MDFAALPTTAVEDGYNGWLVPVQSAEKLAEAMERFLKEPALIESMAQASLEIARNKYDVNIVNQFMLDQLKI